MKSLLATLAVAACLASSPLAAIAPGVYLYQLTNTGFSATITVSGTKYFKDADLN